MAKGDSYLLGIAHGSVESGELLLEMPLEDTGSFTVSYAKQLIAAADQNYPNVMRQARLGPLERDSADGYRGLAILLQLGIPFNNPHAGYDTNSGAPPSGATASVVQQLASLPPLPPAGSGTTIPGTSIQVPTTLHAATPLLIGGGLLVAAIFFSNRKRAS